MSRPGQSQTLLEKGSATARDEVKFRHDHHDTQNKLAEGVTKFTTPESHRERRRISLWKGPIVDGLCCIISPEF